MLFFCIFYDKCHDMSGCSFDTKQHMFGVFAIDEKKRVDRNKCIFATKQPMFGVFTIDEILRYR